MNIFTTLLIQPLANGLAITTHLLGDNLGLGIIVFSLILRTALIPLTKPYMDSMRKMRKYAPELDKIKKRHAKDKVKQAQAQADFYKQKGINPGSGCIPYVLQIVILIAFFNVFNRVLRGEGTPLEEFNALLYGPIQFASDTIINVNFLGINLTQPNIVNLSFLPFAIPGILVILSAAAQLLSSLLTNPSVKVEEKMAQKTKGKEDDLQASMQKSMVYTFPLLTLFIGMRFPAGLALYWFVVSAFQFVQQYTMTEPESLPTWMPRVNLLQSRRLGSKNTKALNAGKKSKGDNKKKK